MYSPIGFAIARTRAKNTPICSQPLGVIRISPAATSHRPGRPASRPSTAIEEYFQALSPPPFSESQPFTYATAIRKNTTEAAAKMTSLIVPDSCTPQPCCFHAAKAQDQWNRQFHRKAVETT